MGTATAKIASLGDHRPIAFDKLMLSQRNVRRVKRGISIDDLAEDIARRGLLENLTVRPMLDDAGEPTGTFEVPAGGRRFQALGLLVKAKRLARTAPIPCNVRDANSPIPDEEDSLAENVHQVALHPLDQFRAFKALVDGGSSIDDIAARFFVTPAIVRQRLRLAAVAPALLDVYAEDGMTLEQLMAFTVSTDEARQVQVWEAVQRSPFRQPHAIRQALTEDSVHADDRRALFVGVEAYEAAGGTVTRDLFEQDRGGGRLTVVTGACGPALSCAAAELEKTNNAKPRIFMSAPSAAPMSSLTRFSTAFTVYSVRQLRASKLVFQLTLSRPDSGNPLAALECFEGSSCRSFVWR